MKAVVAAFNQEKALVRAFSVITNLRMELFQALVSTNGRSPVQHRGADGGGGQQVGAVRAQAALRRHLARTPVVELRQTRVVTWSLYIHACCYLGVAPPTPETRQPVVALDSLVTLVTLPRHVTLHLDTSQQIEPRVRADRATCLVSKRLYSPSGGSSSGWSSWS